MNAQKQKGQTLDAASTQKAIDILKVCLKSHHIDVLLTCPLDIF